MQMARKAAKSAKTARKTKEKGLSVSVVDGVVAAAD
jgi:hypothetical protein